MQDRVGRMVKGDAKGSRSIGRRGRYVRWGALLTVYACSVAAPCAGAQQLSLHEAVQQALAGPQGQAIASRVEQAAGSVRQAGLGINPRLFLQSEDLRPWDNAFSFTQQTEDYGYVDQTFELDGKRHKRVTAATARLDQARANADLARAQIAGRVAAAYWNAVVLRDTAHLLEQDMNAVDEMVRYHKERVDAGAMRGIDLLRMQIERDRLLLALRAAERDAEQANLELFRQMGTRPQPVVALSEALDGIVPVEPVALGAVLGRRADVAAARDAVAAATAEVRLQRANGVPDLDLLGGYKRNSGANTAYAALQIPLPFHNRNQGEIARAQAGVSAAEADLATLDIQVRAEVAQAEQAYAREQEMVQRLLPEMRARAGENLRLMTEAYRIGGVDLLRFLDAERTDYEVGVSALRMEADYQQAALRLQLSYGVQP